MLDLFIIIFAMTLLYMSVVERINTLIRLIAFQGFLLFGIAFVHLKAIDITNLIFILMETVVFKAMVVPYFLFHICERNNITKVTKSAVPSIYSLMFISLTISVSFMAAGVLKGAFAEVKYFIASVSAIIAGLYFIVVHEKVLTHVIGYLVMENGIFLLSIAVGQSMPILVNTGILLDIFVSILILGLFINRVGNVFQSTSVEHLTQLKD